MRVLLFRWSCDTGGVSTSMRLLGRELEHRGIDCEYWFCKGSYRFAEFAATGKATVAPLAKLVPRLERGEFDVLQMTASDPGAALLAQLAAGTRVVVTSRGALSDSWHRGNCFAYTAISRAMAEINQPYTDVEIEVIRNAVDLERFRPPAARGAGRPIVAFVGRTTAAEKDFPRFMRVARLLVGRGMRVWVADPHGADPSRFREAGSDAIPIERWEQVEHDEMPAFYRDVAASGGVVLIPSRTEGFGLAAAEAAASGAMTVASDVFGLRESVIEGHTGRLFAAAASDTDVADLVSDVVATQPSPAACASAASVFAPAEMAESYITLYRRNDQRLVRARPPAASGPAMELLREHLVRQRTWRADACLRSAEGFAATGQHAAALTAIRTAARAAPARLLRPRALRTMVGFALRVAHRPTRLTRQLRQRREAHVPGRATATRVAVP